MVGLLAARLVGEGDGPRRSGDEGSHWIAQLAQNTSCLADHRLRMRDRALSNEAARKEPLSALVWTQSPSSGERMTTTWRERLLEARDFLAFRGPLADDTYRGPKKKTWEADLRRDLGSRDNETLDAFAARWQARSTRSRLRVGPSRAVRAPCSSLSAFSRPAPASSLRRSAAPLPGSSVRSS